MTLYFQWLAPWRGERINDIQYPLSIEFTMPYADKVALGLYQALIPADIPAGEMVDPAEDAVRWDEEAGAVYKTLIAEPIERRRVAKWVIVNRLSSMGLGDAALALLMAPGNGAAFFRWVAPVESVYFDDIETVAMLAALGLDPDQIDWVMSPASAD